MTLLDALRHQWRRRIRSPTWGRSLIGGLFLVLAAGYFGVLFLAAGWFFPRIVAEVVPQQNPLHVLNEFLLYALAGLVAARFLLQRSAGSDVQPYLGLPLRRSQLVRIMQVLSALSLFNLLPVVPLAALWGSTVLPATSALEAAFWGAGVLLALATTQFLNSLLRVAWNRNASLVLGVVALLVFVVVGSNWAGGEVVQNTSAWLFGGLVTGRLLPLSVLVGIVAGTAMAAHWALRTGLYEVLGDESGGTGTSKSGGALLGRRWGQRHITSLVMLDVALILRNKRPRQMMLLGTFVIGMFAISSFSGDSVSAFDKVLFSFFLSGYLGLMYGQFGCAWHGDHFDRLLLHTASPATIIRAQFLTLAGLCAVPLLIVVPIVGVLHPSLLAPLAALLLYNLGVTTPALILVGTWYREALELEQTAFFNYQGTTSGSVLRGIPIALGVMGLPFGLVIGVGFSQTLLVLAGLGVVGLATAPVWIRGLGQVFQWQRYAMAAGFRDE